MIPTYHLWLLIYFALPVLLLEIFAHDHLRPYYRIFPWLIGMCVVMGSLWDVFAAWTGIWWWPSVCCVLPRVDTIPLEELIFMALAAIFIAQLTIIVRDIMRAHHALRKKGSR